MYLFKHSMSGLPFRLFTINATFVGFPRASWISSRFLMMVASNFFSNSTRSVYSLDSGTKDSIYRVQISVGCASFLVEMRLPWEACFCLWVSSSYRNQFSIG